MKNWRSTLGGSLSAFGTFLFGAPMLINAASPNFPKPFMLFCMGFGILLMGFGTFFGHFFAADAKDVQILAKNVDQNASQIAVTKEAVRTGHTEMLAKPVERTILSEDK